MGFLEFALVSLVGALAFVFVVVMVWLEFRRGRRGRRRRSHEHHVAYQPDLSGSQQGPPPSDPVGGRAGD